MQAPQRATPAGTGRAQVWQRGCGWAKRTTHASHTGSAGQAWHTSHWLGIVVDARLSNAWNILSIYSASMPTERPPTIDATAAARWNGMLVTPSPWLHEEVAGRMAERLAWIKLQPAAWADWGPVRGGLQAHALVAEKYPNSQCFIVEALASSAQEAIKKIVKPWWNPVRWTGAATRFETPPDATVQMLWSNMALHMAPDPQALIAQWHRALAVDGFLMFSCLGPDTLRELRDLYQRQGWPPPSHEFTDMHDWGDMLVGAGFAEPVMDMERITLSFATPERLLAELRQLGRNLHPARFGGLRGRQWQRQLHHEMAHHLQAAGKRGGEVGAGNGAGNGLGGEGVPLTLTFEVIYGHALKPAPRLRARPEATMSLDDMRLALAQGKTTKPAG